MTMNSGARQHATPLLIEGLGEAGTARVLRKITLGRSGDADDARHDEAWLQRLIQRFPQALPIDEIEPAFGRLIPVCMELPTPAGYVDNLFVTPSGDLVLAECKLWRNPEARREVVAQAIDYAESLSMWTYEDLQSAVLKVSPELASLHDLVAPATELAEEAFVDAVARNLRLGRIHLMIVGDGIREGVESLTRSIQKHAGFHFTLSLVEMPVFEIADGSYLLAPRILARTTNIERGIVGLADDRLRVAAPAVEPTGDRGRSRTISQERIVEALRTNAPGATEALERFLDKAAEYGVFAEPATKSMVVRWRGPDDRNFSLAAIGEDGALITYNVNWNADGIGRIDLAHEYLETLAALVGGHVRRTKTPAQWYVVRDGTTPPDARDLLAKDDAWLAAIEAYTAKLAAALRAA